MEIIFGRQFDNEIAIRIGQAAMLLLDNGLDVTNESLSNAIVSVTEDDADLATEFALNMLKK